MAYKKKYTKKSSNFEVLEEGVYEFELFEIEGPITVDDYYNPGKEKDEYRWKFLVYKDGIQVHRSFDGEPYTFICYFSDAEGPKSHTGRTLEALQLDNDNMDEEVWRKEAIGRKLLANVHITESAKLTGEVTKKNKVDPRVDIKPIQQGEVKQEAPTNAAEGPPREENAADEKLPF